MTFAQDLTNCDGSLSSIKTAKQCTIPASRFLLAPFNHIWGASIYVKIIAVNYYGESAPSALGNGGILMTNPDSPILVAENVSLRSATSISITWSEGPSNGGDSIIDYRVSMAQDDSNYQVIASNVVGTSYTASELTAGLTY